MANITIRRATPADIEILTQLRVDFLAEVNGTQDPALWAELYAANLAYLREKLPTREFLSWVAEAEGRIIATSGLVLFWRPPNVSNPTGRDGLVINVYTLPEWRGQGIARRLLETLIAHTRTTSVRRLWLYATEEGHPLYAKLGFQPIDDGMELRLT